MTAKRHTTLLDAERELLDLPDHYGVYQSSDGTRFVCAASKQSAEKMLEGAVKERTTKESLMLWVNGIRRKGDGGFSFPMDKLLEAAKKMPVLHEIMKRQKEQR